MIFSPPFQVERFPAPVESSMHYVVFSAVQWKDPNLGVMTNAAKQRFAVLYNERLDNNFMMETLEQAYIQGAMSGVKVIGVHKNLLRLFLSNDVGSASFPAIESLWQSVKRWDLNRSFEVDFSCEQEACSGSSDYLFWPAVKEILESNILGIEQYPIPVLHNCAWDIPKDSDPTSHEFQVYIRQALSALSAATAQLCPMAVETDISKMRHSSLLMTAYYLRSAFDSADA
jgi:hypothetical protein